jgi:hypothetical protein
LPIRNIWSLETGEAVTAEALLENVEGCEVYFPVRDVGVDLLVANGPRHVGVQVKESRYYQGPNEAVGHSWHQLNARNLEGLAADFYVFLTYVPRYGERSVRTFESRFVVVPFSDLKELVSGKSGGKKGVYSFYLSFEGDRVTETREGSIDYTMYLENWGLIKEAISS